MSDKTYDEPPMSSTSKSIEIQVVNITENEDGSATYTFDVSQGANTVISSEGLKLLLYCGAFGIRLDEVYDLIVERAAYLAQEPPIVE